MDKLKSLKNLKIERLITAMTYAVRDNFASNRQELIDSIHLQLNRILKSSEYSGRIDSKVDSDGDITFEYQRGTFQFQLDCKASLSGGQFNDLYEHSLALTILKAFFSQIIKIQGLSYIDVFSVEFQNVFNLRSTEIKNYDILQEKVMPRMKEGSKPLLPNDANIRRVDFKIGWLYDERRTCYYTIRCPGNEGNLTIWTSLNMQTRDDDEGVISQDLVMSDIDTCYVVYCGQYTDTLKVLLADTELDFTPRQLQRP